MPADLLAWDPTGLSISGGHISVVDPNHTASPRSGFNAGCPEGYFAQFVAPGESMAAGYGNPGSWVRCRLLTTSTPQTIADESGVSLSEAVSVYRDAASDTIAQAAHVGAGILGALQSPLVLLGLGAVALFFLTRRR